jgi:hypothetical protein
VFLEYEVPSNFSGVINFAFGHGGFCDAWKSERGKLQTTDNGFNEKKYLDILKNPIIMLSNNTS